MTEETSPLDPAPETNAPEENAAAPEETPLGEPATTETPIAETPIAEETLTPAPPPADAVHISQEHEEERGAWWAWLLGGLIAGAIIIGILMTLAGPNVTRSNDMAPGPQPTESTIQAPPLLAPTPETLEGEAPTPGTPSAIAPPAETLENNAPRGTAPEVAPPVTNDETTNGEDANDEAANAEAANTLDALPPPP